MNKLIILILASVCWLNAAKAQIDQDETGIWKYLSIQTDLSVFQSNFAPLGGKALPKFTMYPSFTVYSEFYSQKRFGIQSGLSFKNVALKWRSGSSIHVRKVSGIGIPVLFRFGKHANSEVGKIGNNHYAFAGAEMSFLFYQKGKDKVNGVKSKKREFFPNDVNMFQPSVFIGLRRPITSFKLTAYPRNLLSQNNENSQMVSASIVIEPVGIVLVLGLLGLLFYQYG